MKYFELSDIQLSTRETAREFAVKKLLPGVIDRDRNLSFPKELVDEMAALGLMGMMVDPVYNGGGMDTLSYILALEEISKVDASAAVIMSVNNSLVCHGLQNYGTEWQKQNYLSKLATGEYIGSFCLSEPEAGSDAANLKTICENKGDHYLIHGTKNWITNGQRSDIHIVMANGNPDLGHRGINTLIVEKKWPGVTIGVKEDKMGIRASDTTSIIYENVKVPKENLIEAEGHGFKYALNTLDGGRIGIAAQALGIATGAYEIALKYSKERITFGKPIFDHQIIQFKLADMATEIEGARHLVYRAAWLKEQGKDYSAAAAMAKYVAAEMAMKQTTQAVQILGGYGYVREYHVERMMRDAKITQIYEGTSEIQQLVLSREILKGNLYPAIL
ncbi:MAG: acyl-CoA dehydrogenase family protein [Saprospiraceae bacterium]